ncbi:hypothetical protein HanRHA438_Chr00c09g0847901 [Helianthus annuus]|uniref:Putative alfin n=1 Tax=Helianthus annuus TaxID=4232 RepID=A0A251UM58_HELAN|nr:hypothetical protein HanXRQr2_Chr05g0196161 [Helianthus annuus]KAJ0954706.1 hypothetical protein HanRHA438_Chr00c09g0847901 [Helianthus annuus]
MEMAAISSGPRTVEEIFNDYNARRAGIVQALTYGIVMLMNSMRLVGWCSFMFKCICVIFERFCGVISEFCLIFLK